MSDETPEPAPLDDSVVLRLSALQVDQLVGIRLRQILERMPDDLGGYIARAMGGRFGVVVLGSPAAIHLSGGHRNDDATAGEIVEALRAAFKAAMVTLGQPELGATPEHLRS